MRTHTRPWLALDIGGANLKAAHQSGEADSVYFPLWKFPDRLALEIQVLAQRFPKTEDVSVTMTAELCDCYETKREGVLAILDALVDALPGRHFWIWGIDGRFHAMQLIREQPLLAAASNWLALATAIARRYPRDSGLLIDIGSTTTDLIPVENGEVAAIGKNDLERLQSGELVYAGVSRTPLCALATSLVYRGKKTGIAAELFATTKDIYLTLGDIKEDPLDNETADGRPASRHNARDRLARMVGADRECFFDNDAFELSKSLDKALLERLAEAGRKVSRSLAKTPAVVVISGSGEFLARRLSHSLFGEEVRLVPLGEVWGSNISTAACARALLELSADRQLFDDVHPEPV